MEGTEGFGGPIEWDPDEYALSRLRDQRDAIDRRKKRDAAKEFAKEESARLRKEIRDLGEEPCA